MAKDMSTAILADKIAQIRPDAHISHGRFVVPPLLHGEALEEDESLAIDEIFSDFFQMVGQFGKGEVFLYTYIYIFFS